MRVFLGLLGAVIGVLAGIFFVGSSLGDIYLQQSEFSNPDDAGNAHMGIFAGTTIALLLMGYIAGYLIGWQIERSDDDDD